MRGNFFTGPGRYRLLWRSARDEPGTSRDVWIEELADREVPGLLGVWSRPAVFGDSPILIARITLKECERNLVNRRA